jgi:hypothetical protein
MKPGVRATGGAYPKGKAQPWMALNAKAKALAYLAAKTYFGGQDGKAIYL